MTSSDPIRLRPINDPAHPGIEVWTTDEQAGYWCGVLAESLRAGQNTSNSFSKSVWELVPLPIPTEPGTVFEATVRGVPNVRVMVAGLSDFAYVSNVGVDGTHAHRVDNIDPATVRILLAAPTKEG